MRGATRQCTDDVNDCAAPGGPKIFSTGLSPSFESGEPPPPHCSSESGVGLGVHHFQPLSPPPPPLRPSRRFVTAGGHLPTAFPTARTRLGNAYKTAPFAPPPQKTRLMSYSPGAVWPRRMDMGTRWDMTDLRGPDAET